MSLSNLMLVFITPDDSADFSNSQLQNWFDLTVKFTIQKLEISGSPRRCQIIKFSILTFYFECSINLSLGK